MRYRDFLSHVLIEPEFYMILKEEGLPMARRADGSYWDMEAQAAWILFLATKGSLDSLVTTRN